MERRATTVVEQHKNAVRDIAGAAEGSGHVVAPDVIAPSSPVAGQFGWQRADVGSPQALGARFVTPDNDAGSKDASVLSPVVPSQHRKSAAKKGLVFEVPASSSDGKGSPEDVSTVSSRSRSANSSMPPPPTTPTRKSRRSPPRTVTPAKPKTPKGGLAALRLGADVGSGVGGDDDDDDGGQSSGASVTPSKDKSRGPNRALEMTPTKKSKGRAGAFGRAVDGSPMKERIAIPAAVSRVYGLVQKATGSVGGNGNSGAIYGELTVGGMQKVVNLLKEKTSLDENSSFIDVGSGLGKPNFHVAQDPGCEISYGLELEEIRWNLSVVNHRRVVRDDGGADAVDVKKHNLFFAHGDILSAKTFDPFTHVYMFDIGFPPDTLRSIANIFNASQARHLISYQKPYKIEEYGFNVDKILQMPLTLTVSNEGHMMYLYRRKEVAAGLPTVRILEVDPFFAEGVSLCRDGGDGSRLFAHVEARFTEHMSGGIRTRRARRATSTR